MEKIETQRRRPSVNPGLDWVSFLRPSGLQLPPRSFYLHAIWWHKWHTGRDRWMDGRRGVVLGGLFGMWRRFFNKGGGRLGDISRLYFFSPRLHLKAGHEVAVKIFFKPELTVLNPNFTNQKGSISLLIALILECRSEIYSSSGIVFEEVFLTPPKLWGSFQILAFPDDGSCASFYDLSRAARFYSCTNTSEWLLSSRQVDTTWEVMMTCQAAWDICAECGPEIQSEKEKKRILKILCTKIKETG